LGQEARPRAWITHEATAAWCAQQIAKP